MGIEIKTQVEAARKSALALPLPELATLVVTGKDRVSWLNGMLTCDLVRRGPGEATYGLAVARNGRVISDVVVVIDEDAQRVLMAVPRDVMETLYAHLDHYLVMDDAEVVADANAFESWAIHGPSSSIVLDAARAAGAPGGMVDRTGLGGAIVLGPAARSAETRSAVEHAIATTSGSLGDGLGWESLRLERAVPRFGVDFDDKTYPQEASLENTAVRFDKGCYLGQEVVCMLQMRGHVKRRLASLVLEGGDPPPHRATVTDPSGSVVGEVTSAAQSPMLDRPVALASLKRAYAEAGKKVVVSGVPAEVVDRPA
jgi:folate-binding protein YgfZ